MKNIAHLLSPPASKTLRHTGKSYGVSANDALPDYAYDGLSRLTSARSYRESGRAGRGDYTASYTYDLNSNPLTIKRNGLTDAVSASGSARLEFGEVDNLSLAYSGARPLRVSEAADDTPYSGSSDYPAGKNSGKDMAYDLDGRLVSDPSRSVDTVLYNSIGLPREIKVRGGSGVKRLYSADGRLLRTVVRDTGMEIYEGTLPGSGKPTSPGTSAGLGTLPWDFGSGSGQGVTVDIGTRDTTDYRGPLRYLNGSLDRRVTPTGYVKADTAYYFVTDHQGNVRQVVRGTDGRVVQEAHYYPYGGLFGESSATALEAVNGIGENDRLFGGKERTALSDLHFLDFEARLYDPQLGMFWTCDPMMEKYYPYSYRLYCLANPVNLTDPTGCVVKLNGDAENVDKYCTMLSNATGTQFSVDGDGILSAGDKIDTKGRTSETLLNVAMSAIESDNVYNLNMVGADFDSEVFIDSFKNKSVDVVDLEKAGECSTAFQGALIGHFLNEIQEPVDFDTAHDRSCAIEAQIYGELTGKGPFGIRQGYPVPDGHGGFSEYIYEYSKSHKFSISYECTQRFTGYSTILGIRAENYDLIYNGIIKSIRKIK